MRSFSRFALDGDVTAHRLGQALADREAQPGSRRRARAGRFRDRQGLEDA